FAHVRDFMVNFIENLDVGPDTIRIGVAQYSDDPSAEFYLNTYSTKTQVLDAVKGLQLRGGEELKTGAALQFLVDSYFTESAGSRAGDGVPQAVFLITSNVSSDDISQAEQALKEGSINAFCIGVRNADPNELTQIASFSTFIAMSSEFRDIANLQQQFLSLVSDVALAEYTPWTFIADEGIPTRFQATRRDIVFLFDGTSSVGKSNRDFILKIINKLNIDPDAVRVGLVQYSDNPRTEFNLSTYQTKTQVQRHLRNLKPKGGQDLNTGAALDYVFRNHFNSSAGSRKEQGIPQILVLLTGGRSIDDFRQAASALKQDSIMTFAIGSKNADQAELDEIAFEPSLVFNVGNVIVTMLCNYVKRNSNSFTQFSTVDCTIFLHRLSSIIHLNGKALAWFESY
uniref:VWFA domain-containing protein n=1 Tax=Callorhinchus milii TaxID=7868 RepID=A0A4W3JCI9_CALMI